MSNYSINAVDFHGQSIPTIFYNEQYYVGMKAIVENIGLDWEAQRQRIKRHPVLNSVASIIKATGKDGKIYNMLCLPIDVLNGWLFGVDANRVKVSARDSLIQYQRECFKVLFSYFHKKTAQPKLDDLSTVQSREPLAKAVVKMVAIKHINYSDAWKIVHQWVGVDKASNMTDADVEKGLRYVHELTVGNSLEGELLPKTETVTASQSNGIALMEFGGMVERVQNEKLRKAKAMIDEATSLLNDASTCSSAIYDGFNESSLHFKFSRSDRDRGKEEANNLFDGWKKYKRIL